MRDAVDVERLAGVRERAAPIEQRVAVRRRHERDPAAARNGLGGRCLRRDLLVLGLGDGLSRLPGSPRDLVHELDDALDQTGQSVERRQDDRGRRLASTAPESHLGRFRAVAGTPCLELPYDRAVDEPGRHLVYSVTKAFLGVLCLRLELDLEAPVATWVDDDRLPAASLRQLLNHTSGIPDYARLPEYAAAVRDSPSEPWSDEELLARPLAHGADFEPGGGWAYSNTGYLLVRRVVDGVADGGFAGALQHELLGPLGLVETSLALEPADLEGLVAGHSAQVGSAWQDVRGRYHPRWVGHRTLASTAADLRGFWSALAAGELCDLGALTDAVEIGFDAPGFVRPSYGIGVMTDPGWPGGLLIGHGGGGPGYAAAAFTVVRRRNDPLVAIELSGDERVDVQARALDALRERSTSG